MITDRPTLPTGATLTAQLNARLARLALLACAGVIAWACLAFGVPEAILWFTVLGVITGAIGAARGHDFLTWCCYGFICFPVALISVFLTPRSTVGQRQCPHCAEWVKAEARVCRYCQRDLPSA